MPRISLRRRRKKSRKLLGRRYHGYGQVGEHKGSGQSGGKGMAGGKDHKKMMMLKMGYQFGTRGFTDHGPKIILNPINVGRLVELIKENKIKYEKEGDKYVVKLDELPYNKILGNGAVDIPLKIVLGKGFISRKAEEKIISAGGEIVRQ